MNKAQMKHENTINILNFRSNENENNEKEERRPDTRSYTV